MTQAMRVFAAALATESNSFSPVPTSLRSFHEGLYYNGRDQDVPLDRPGAEGLRAWRDGAAASGFDFILGPMAFAEPSGPTVAPAYAALRDEILAGVRAALPLDVVLLHLHGAMIVEGCDDAEGDLIADVRAVVGDRVTIGVLIDPHAHLTRRMVEGATLLSAYHQWPHTDVAERAAHLFALAVEAATGAIRPVASVFDCRMISSYPTRPAPMARFVADMAQAETRRPVLSVDLIHGFPWGDTAETGTRMLVWTDQAQVEGAALAEAFGRRLFTERDALTLKLDMTLDQALDHISQPAEGLSVLCDVGDVVPAGAPGDSTFVLRRVLERGIANLCFGPLWDPMATAICLDAGIGARLPLRIGGKAGKASGDPVDVMATVRAILTAAIEPVGRQFGDRVWVTLDQDIDLILHSVRASTEAIAAVTDLGLDPRTRRAFIGKMLMHGGTAFAPIASEVITVATPGTLTFPERDIPLTKRTGAWWPKVADPFRE
jgi:microcystin degradation protein MlrC